MMYENDIVIQFKHLNIWHLPMLHLVHSRNKKNKNLQFSKAWACPLFPRNPGFTTTALFYLYHAGFKHHTKLMFFNVWNLVWLSVLTDIFFLWTISWQGLRPVWAPWTKEFFRWPFDCLFMGSKVLRINE